MGGDPSRIGVPFATPGTIGGRSMTVLDSTPLVVAPAPTPAPAPPPPVVAPPTPAPPIARRRSRPLLAAAASVVAAASAIVAWSPWSSPTGAGTSGVTAPPSYARLTSVSPHSIAFRWSPPLTDTSVVGYEIVRNGVLSDFVMPTQQTYVASGLAAGRQYRFEVVAIYAHSVSSPSALIFASTP